MFKTKVSEKERKIEKKQISNFHNEKFLFSTKQNFFLFNSFDNFSIIFFFSIFFFQIIKYFLINDGKKRKSFRIEKQKKKERKINGGLDRGERKKKYHKYHHMENIHSQKWKLR